jgi:hypothetical protein
MSAADKVAAYDKMMAEKATTAGPPRYRVIESLQRGGANIGRVFFSSVSQARAKAWIEARCPRGTHWFLMTPDGEMLSYEAERLTGGPQGEELDAWQPFDRDAYQAPELEPVNTHDPWADAWEGAQ